MKHSMNTCIALSVLCATLVAAPLFAQEWLAAQGEIGENVEAYWTLAAQSDLEGFLGYIHADYSGWAYDDALPRDKTSLRK